MAKQLSDRAIELLVLIRENSVDRFWTPDVERCGGGRGCDDWCHEFNRHLNVFGSDFNILRSLHAKGLISRPQTSLTNKYVFLITEDGSLAIETYREAGHRLFA